MSNVHVSPLYVLYKVFPIRVGTDLRTDLVRRTEEKVSGFSPFHYFLVLNEVFH